MVFLLLSPSLVFGSDAGLSLSPSDGSHRVGDTFSVDIVVSSSDDIDTGGAVLEFDSDLIRVQNVSDANSIFGMWPEEPDFSNVGGTIEFAGGTPRPFSGQNGNIITVTFRAVEAGSASVSFREGELLRAGDVLFEGSDFGQATYTIEEASEPDPDPTPDPDPDPDPTPGPTEAPTPRVDSLTHPDQYQWYSDSSPYFSWDVPGEVDAVRISMSRDEDETPDEVHSPPIEEYEAENLEDGVWFFAIQFQSGDSWGDVARRRVQIDNTPPEGFNLEVDNEEDPQNPRPLFKFQTRDELSGIDYYTLILNDETYAELQPEELENGSYRPSSLPPDEYFLIVRAVDRAGNSIADFINFSIEPIPLEIEEIDLEVTSGSYFRVTGTTSPEAEVAVFIRKINEDEAMAETVRAGEDGSFDYRKVLPEGTYEVWLEARNQRGARSLPTDPETLRVGAGRAVVIVSIILIVLILAGLIVAWRLWAQLSKEKQELEKDSDTVKVKKQAYGILEEKIKEQIRYLEGKVDLSRSESRLLEELRESLEITEEAKIKEDQIEENNQ